MFYTPGHLNLKSGISLSVNKACIVMVKSNGNTVEEVTVSDPTQKHKTIDLTFNDLLKASTQESKVKVIPKNKNSLVEVQLPQEGLAGKSVHIKFVT